MNKTLSHEHKVPNGQLQSKLDIPNPSLLSNAHDKRGPCPPTAWERQENVSISPSTVRGFSGEQKGREMTIKDAANTFPQNVKRLSQL